MSKLDSMTTKLTKLEDKANIKSFHADTLEKRIAELQQIIETQNGDILQLTTTAERRFKKLSEADKKAEMVHACR